MIIVHNNEHGDILGFSDIKAYWKWLDDHPEWDFFNDNVYDIGTGGFCTSDNYLDLNDEHCALCDRRNAEKKSQ